MESLIEDFSKHTKKFQDGPADANGAKEIVQIRKKILFSFVGKKTIGHFRKSIHNYSTILGLILQSLNGSVLKGQNYLCLLICFQPGTLGSRATSAGRHRKSPSPNAN